MNKYYLKIFIFLLFLSSGVFFGIFYFFWQKKPKEISFQANTTNSNFTFFEWKKVTEKAPWSGRDAHWAVVFKDKIWLMGGVAGGKIKVGNVPYGDLPHKSDVWASENGKDWQIVLENAPWGERRSAAASVFKNKIWLMGGWTKKFGETKNDVWVSDDGANWKLILSSAPWPEREGHAVAVFQDKLFLVGGVNFYKRKTYNDVWYSEDGINWIEATSSAPWSKRYDHTLTVFKNKLWLIGGIDFGEQIKNDVWVSEDGINWNLVTENPPWPARHGHVALVYKNYLFIIGGWSKNGGLNDVWYTENGQEWYELKSLPNWQGREDHAGVVFKDKIFILGGMVDFNDYLVWANDIWGGSFSE